MTVADLVFEFLAARKVRDVFTVTGGGIMHLVDALGRNPDMRYWCNHHEQACAIAAEAYARVTGGVGVCLVTTGPGSTNALSGIAGAWVDSVPVVVISGQVRTDLIAHYSKHRQFGPQEIDIISMARPVTKYAHTLTPTDDVQAQLERAVRTATSGRPGPVWLNIPLDVQGMTVREPGSGVHAQSAADGSNPRRDGQLDELATVLGLLAHANRPLAVCGSGIRMAGAEDLLLQFVERFGCPVVATIGGMDLMPEEHTLYMGRFGPTGQRRANFAIQNADLLLCLGTSMSVAAIGFDADRFAPMARKVMVNIDAEESNKPNLAVDFSLVADVKWFLAETLENGSYCRSSRDGRWLDALSEWKSRYPLVTADHSADVEHVNSYVLVHRISEAMRPGEVILSGNGLDAQSVFHSFAVKTGQRVITNRNYGAMGWDLPAAVGASVARGGAQVVLVTGDGSIEMNVQELLTIGHNRMDIKIFILNNSGYQSIRATQALFCAGRFIGCDAASGVSNPDFESLASAYGLEYRVLRSNQDLEDGVRAVLAVDGPCLCEVNVSYHQERNPRIVSRRREDGTFESSPLDDQYPFLPEEEREAVMSLFRQEGVDS
ncbi:MAG: thiamine pyrophosphate-binding protein [Actinomycetota bacterium]|nr:thiamine pyrophosphate-binding protein [Actinomycetota bacterium]